MSSFTYWPAVEPPDYTNFIPDSSKSKFLRQSVFFFNNIPKQELPVQQKPGKARPYFCEECGKSFLLKHHLTTHLRTHTGIRPHVCSHCGKSFTHKHCLNTHLLLHSSDRPYQCLECKKSFTLKHHLITHSKVSFRD